MDLYLALMPDSKTRLASLRLALACFLSFSFLFLAACTISGGAGRPATPRDVFTAGLRGIDTIYVRDVSLRDVTFAGLSRLSQLDAALGVNFTADSAVLNRDNTPVRTLPLPATGDPRAWAGLAADMVEAAKAV